MLSETEELSIKLLTRNRVGALLRIFASSPEVVEYQIQSALNAAKKLEALKIGQIKVFSRIDFLVSSDSRFEDCDVADITQKLREKISTTFPDEKHIRVLEIKQGDIFCILLNYGIVNQLEDRVPYSFIISHTADRYITQENISTMLSAMQNKARVAGLQIDTLKEQIAKGRVINTFIVWHNKSLLSVGGFDLRAAKPLKGHVCKTVTGVCSYEKATTFTKREYHIAGCEEVIPLIRMINIFGKCISPIPATNTEKIWGPDSISDPEGYERHLNKIATKTERQEHFAKLMGVTTDYLQDGIL